MYAGLTISDKPALLDAKVRGVEWVARDLDFEKSINGFSEKPKRIDWTWTCSKGFFDKRKNIKLCDGDMKFVHWFDAEPVNIDLALAQIAEMESAEKPMTWNERINQMTVEEKAEWIKEYLFDAACEGVCMYNGCNGACTENIIAFFNSPYTEGETK